MDRRSSNRTARTVARRVGQAYDQAVGTPDMTFRATRQRAMVADLLVQGQTPRRWAWSAVVAVAVIAMLVLGVWRGGALDRSPETSTPVAAPVAAVTAQPPAPVVEPGRWIQAPPGEAATLPLGPSASGTLAAGGAARTRTRLPLGDEVWLEAGEVRLDIEPGTGGRWTVYAGPFRVEVVGTVFSVAWEGPKAPLHVSVLRGEVRVTGGALAPSGLSIVGGQRASIGDGGSDVRVQRLEAPREDATTDANTRKATSRKRVKATEKNRPREDSNWRSLFSRGRFDAAYRAAERVGFDRLLGAANGDTLHDLADVARLHRDLDLAERALRTIRRRFPGGQEAARAAFELGRIAADQRDAPVRARAWFERYLAERPRGTWARDARGRILRASTGEGGDVARAAAEAYLQHHPDGPDAATARRVLEP